MQSPKRRGTKKGWGLEWLKERMMFSLTPSLREESWRVSHTSASQPPLCWGWASGLMTHSDGLCPWRVSGLYSELTVMSRIHPTGPFKAQFCLGPTGDAYLLAFSALAASEKTAAELITKQPHGYSPSGAPDNPAPYIIGGRVQCPAQLGRAMHVQE